MGIQIPVVSCAAKYHSSARFGEQVRIYLEKRAYNGVRLTVGYRVVDAEQTVRSGPPVPVNTVSPM